MTECGKCSAKTDLYLCKHCMVDLRRQLLSIPTLIDDLNDAAIGNTRLSNESSRQKGFQSRTPVFDDRATDLIEEISMTVGQWGRALARTHGLMISPPVSWHKPWDLYKHTVKDFAMFLAAHVDKLARDPDIGELCADLKKYIKRAHGIVDRRTPAQFCGPCPATVIDHRHCVKVADGGSCNGYRDHQCAVRLMARRGALEVTCPSCGAVHRVEALVNHLLAHVDDHRYAIPDLYRVLRMLNKPVEMKTLYYWALPRVGRLKPAGYVRPDNGRIGITRQSDDEKPIYRVSDACRQREESMKPGRRGRPMKNEGKKKV
jgi:hypothetical protein